MREQVEIRCVARLPRARALGERDRHWISVREPAVKIVLRGCISPQKGVKPDRSVASSTERSYGRANAGAFLRHSLVLEHAEMISVDQVRRMRCRISSFLRCA